MPRNERRKKVKRLQREDFAKFPEYLALLQQQTILEIAARIRFADCKAGLIEAVAGESRLRLN